MKKLLAALALLSSVCATNTSYAQVELYHDIDFFAYENSSTEAEIAIPPALVWFFGGVGYWALNHALDAAWDSLQEWRDNPGDKNYDDNLRDVCDFYWEYNADYDLERMRDAINESGILCP